MGSPFNAPIAQPSESRMRGIRRERQSVPLKKLYRKNDKIHLIFLVEPAGRDVELDDLAMIHKEV
jgi:hypothetical protein